MQRLEFSSAIAISAPDRSPVSGSSTERRRDIGSHQSAAEMRFLLGVSGQPRSPCVRDRREIEQAARSPRPRVDLCLRHAAIFQRERQILSASWCRRSPETEHLRDIALWVDSGVISTPSNRILPRDGVTMPRSD